MRLKLFLIISLLALAIFKIDAETKSAEKPGFTWGVDIGSSIDMSNNQMSTVDADAYFGFKNQFFRTLGVGASVHTAFGNNHTMIPVYLILRTNFSYKPRLCFMDLRAGYSFNTIESNYEQQGMYGSLGLGFNLYTSPKFKSHIILAYNYTQINSYYKEDQLVNLSDLHSMSVRIGISF